MSTLKERLAAVETRQAEIAEAKDRAASGRFASKSRTPKQSEVFGNPNVRRGESALTGRGLRFTKLFGVMANAGAGFPGLETDAWQNAKVEREVVGMLEKAFRTGPGSPGSVGSLLSPRTLLAPLSSDLMPDEMANDPDFGLKIKSLVHLGTEGADWDEMRAMAQKSYQAPGQKASTLSWLDQTLGGALVGPPEFRDLIELLRNKAVLTAAGAQTVPLGPTGRAIYPRQTGASVAAYVGEGAPIGQSEVKTGSLTLSGKRLALLLKMSNDLLRYSSPAAEALARNDMMKSLALGVDKYGLEGGGGDITPLGIINTPGIATVTPTTVGNDGNTMSEGDWYSFPSAVEENNAEFKAFIIRPQMHWNRMKKRTDAVTGSDAAGPFLWNQFRGLDTNFSMQILAGFPAYRSNQVSITRTKGAGTTLTYALGGDFTEVLIAMFGAIEFALATQGDTAFQYDQTWIRGISINDIGVRHPGAIAAADTLIRG